jgi:hypothetical protein
LNDLLYQGRVGEGKRDQPASTIFPDAIFEGSVS